MEETNTTIDYYDSNANQYFSNTVNVAMSECCDRFLKYVVPGGRIIDIGAGSGRDVRYFKDRSYNVDGVDASQEMCRLASDLQVLRFDAKGFRIGILKRGMTEYGQMHPCFIFRLQT